MSKPLQNSSKINAFVICIKIFYDMIPLNCFISDAALFIMPAPFLMYPLIPFKLKPSGLGDSEKYIKPNLTIILLLIKLCSSLSEPPKCLNLFSIYLPLLAIFCLRTFLAFHLTCPRCRWFCRNTFELVLSYRPYSLSLVVVERSEVERASHY